MIKIKAIVTSDQTEDALETVKYALNMEDAEKMQLAIANVVQSRMDKSSPNYTEGIKWGVRFELEEVTDNTVLEDITVSDLKLILAMIGNKEL